MKEEFDNLILLYKNMNTEDKKKALINEFKYSLAALEKLKKDLNINHELLISKEILDVDKETATLDDYLEAYYVYLHMLNDSILAFAEKVSNEFYE